MDSGPESAKRWLEPVRASYYAVPQPGIRSLICAFGLLLVLGGTGCEDVAQSLFDKLARRDCRLDSSVRVSDRRYAYLFAHNHLFRAPGDDLASWANQLTSKIPASFEEMNAIMSAADVGIAVLPLRSDLTENAEMAPVHVDDGGRPQEPSRSFIYQTSSNEPQFVHTYWSPSGTTLGVGGYGGGVLPDKGYVGMIERPVRPNTPEELGLRLAHELGHFMALGHEEIPNNLMENPAQGGDLEDFQIAKIREYVNTKWTPLLVMSCVRDAALHSEFVEEYSGEDLLRAIRRVSAEADAGA